MFIKKDLYSSKEAYIHQKRPMFIKKRPRIKRGLRSSKEANVHQEKPMFIKKA